MQRIHRRKNEQIEKQYPCPQNCGKAYGSYAALYTHVRNKHTNAKPPEMKSGAAKVPQKQMPKKANTQQSSRLGSHYEYDCKICKKMDCVCEEQIDSTELQKAIAVMNDQTYIKFINYLGVLHFSEKSGWIRNTEQSFEYIGYDRLRQMLNEFKIRYDIDYNLSLSDTWLQYLSYTSRAIDRVKVHEFYNGLFMIMSKENIKDAQNILSNSIQFDTIRKSIEIRQKQWIQFMQFIKVIK